jgi:hypothetical protein
MMEQSTAAGSHCGGVRRILLRLRHLTAFILTRNHWRDEMIKRGVAHYNWTTGKWEWGEPPSGPPAANDPPAGSPESMRAMLAKRRG